MNNKKTTCKQLCHPDDVDCPCNCEDCHAWNRLPLNPVTRNKQ